MVPSQLDMPGVSTDDILGDMINGLVARGVN
jgi:hypothetical protein